MSRFAFLVPLAVVLGLYGFVAHTFLVPLVLFAVASGATTMGPRLAVDRATQRVFAIVVSVLAVAIARASIDPDEAQRLHAFWVGVIAAATLIVSFRAVCKAPDGGSRTTISFELVALIAAGETRIGAPYVVAIVLFLTAAIWALRMDDPDRPSLAHTSTRSLRIGFLIVMLTCVIAGAVAAPARPLANIVHRKIDAVFDRAYQTRGSTFSDGMRLGKLSRMLGSNAVAVRIYVPKEHKPSLLRAVVFDKYDDGMFSHSEAPLPDALVETKRGPLVGSDVAYAMRGSRETDRFFLPLGAYDLSTAAGQIRTEPFGIFRGSSAEATKRYWYRARADVRTESLASSASRSADLDIPQTIRGPLTTLAEAWADGATTDELVLARIEEHLRNDFTYALGREHDRGPDPVLHFLFRDRSGHCEYFAAAMTLLARAKGIPARYVAGYRVTERNPIDGHYVVREKNAHSWVEALPRANGTSPKWTTFDPTPMAEQFGTGEAADESLGDASIDFVRSLWDRTEAWLVDRTLTELTVAAVVGTLAFALVRSWRNRKTKAHLVPDRDARPAPPLPYLVELLEALGKAGFRRESFVPLERFARDLPDETARALLLRYAAHRYGNVEDPELGQTMRAHARAVASRPP